MFEVYPIVPLVAEPHAQRRDPLVLRAAALRPDRRRLVGPRPGGARRRHRGRGRRAGAPRRATRSSVGGDGRRRPDRRGHRPPAAAHPQPVRQRRCRDPSGEEHRSVDLLAGYLAGIGDHEIFEPQPGRQSLVVRLEGSDPDAPTLLLMGHTDVVPVNPDGWSSRPVRCRSGRRVRVGTGRGRHAQPHRLAGGRLPAPGRERLRAAGHAHLPRGGRRGGARHAGAPTGCSTTSATRCHADYVLTESGGFQIPTPAGTAAAGARGREGHLLDEDHGARHAGPRLAAVPHRQRAHHRGRGGASHRRLPPADPDPRVVASVRRGHALRARAHRRAARAPTASRTRSREFPVGVAREYARVHAHHVRADGRRTAARRPT